MKLNRMLRVRIDSETLQKIEKAARAENRSVSNYARKCMTDAAAKGANATRLTFDLADEGDTQALAALIGHAVKSELAALMEKKYGAK